VARACRREGPAQRFDFAFPQRAVSMPGWQNWQPPDLGLRIPRILRQYTVRSGRHIGAFFAAQKFLLMLQAALSVTVIVFIASIAIAAMK